MIYNPPEIAQYKEVASQRGNKSWKSEENDSFLDSKDALKVTVKMEHVLPVFIHQLKMLLGFSSGERVRCFNSAEWPAL